MVIDPGQMSWEEVSYVIRSKTRKLVLMHLESEKTPTILSKELHISMPNVSRALAQLRQKGLVDCMTPRARVGKIFVVSNKGRSVLEKVRKMTGAVSAF
ncbi:MAG: ArsR family transcriptional regulator [Nitrososphaerales archaeon]